MIRNSLDSPTIASFVSKRWNSCWILDTTYQPGMYGSCIFLIPIYDIIIFFHILVHLLLLSSLIININHIFLFTLCFFPWYHNTKGDRWESARISNCSHIYIGGCVCSFTFACSIYTNRCCQDFWKINYRSINVIYNLQSMVIWEVYV